MQTNSNSVPAAELTTLAVTGMHCGSCRRRIDAALRQLDGVEAVRVDLAQAQVEVRHRPSVVVAAMLAAIEAEGYGARIA